MALPLLRRKEKAEIAMFWHGSGITVRVMPLENATSDMFSRHPPSNGAGAGAECPRTFQAVPIEGKVR